MFKMVLVGDDEVGKTSMKRYTEDKFETTKIDVTQVPSFREYGVHLVSTFVTQNDFLNLEDHSSLSLYKHTTKLTLFEKPREQRFGRIAQLFQRSTLCSCK